MRTFSIPLTLTKYEVKCDLGDLIPRHRKVFNNNHFFRGMVLPSPREREPLEAKYPTASAHTISFLKVRTI